MAPESPMVVRVPNDVLRLWFSLARRTWTSLVVMPPDFRGNSLALAQALAHAGAQAGGGPIVLKDAQQMEVSQTAALIEEVTQPSEKARATIIAVSSPLVSPAAIPLALAADGVLLSIELGTSEIDAAQKTLEMIGRDRFWGAVALTPGALS